MDSMSVPPAALRDENSVEIIRVWIAEQGLHSVIKIGRYAEDGPEREIFAWGVILADLTQHIADALSAHGLGPRADLFTALVDAYDREVSEPTSGRTGEWARDAN